jgi:hypothetical protein
VRTEFGVAQGAIQVVVDAGPGCDVLSADPMRAVGHRLTAAAEHHERPCVTGVFALLPETRGVELEQSSSIT